MPRPRRNTRPRDALGRPLPDGADGVEGPPGEAGFWRGLAQLAVGVTHAARGNGVGAVRLLERGAANLVPFADRGLHGVDAAAVRAWSAAAVATVGRGVPVTLPPPPLPHGDAPSAR